MKFQKTQIFFIFCISLFINGATAINMTPAPNEMFIKQKNLSDALSTATLLINSCEVSENLDYDTNDFKREKRQLIDY